MARFRSRRAAVVLGLVLALLVAGGASAWYVVQRGNRDVHRGADLPFSDVATDTFPTVPTAPTTTAPSTAASTTAASTTAPSTTATTASSTVQAPPPSTPWAMWGFDPQHTRFNPEATQRPPFGSAWKVSFGDLVEFPPVADDDGVYVETNRGLLVALDPETGRIRWRHRVASGSNVLASSPAMDAQRLYVTSLSGHVECVLRATGEPCWKLELGSRTESSPILVDGTVYFGAEAGDLYAVDAATGKVRWKAHADGALKASPAYDAGRLYIGGYDGHVYAFDAATGKRIWSTGSIGRLGGFQAGRFYSTPAVAYGRVYLGSQDDRVYSLVAETGQIAWTFSTGGWIYSGPAVAYRTVFIGSYDHRLYALDARTGERRWSFDTGGPISGAPTVVNGVVYISAFDRGTFGLDAATGKVLYQVRDGRYSPIVATRDAVYLAGSTAVYRLNGS